MKIFAMARKAKKFNVYAWLETYIYEQVEGEECIDNLRWADVDDPEDMADYNKRKKQGCCGFFDGRVTAPDGYTYVVGCNYGH